MPDREGAGKVSPEDVIAGHCELIARLRYLWGCFRPGRVGAVKMRRMSRRTGKKFKLKEGKKIRARGIPCPSGNVKAIRLQEKAGQVAEWMRHPGMDK